jgi:glycosyltransferase involved in cell wall biosynthesis
MGTTATSAHVIPRLSVVIPTRNRQSALHRVLRSLQHQTLAPSAYEVLVVDDGSDPPVRCASSTGGPMLRLIRLPHVERSAARNQGAREARGEILVFIDDDMLPGRNLLEAHAVAQAEWPSALAAGEITLPPETLRTPFGLFRSGLETSALPSSRGPVSRPNFATAANMSVSRDRFLALGGFDPSIVTSEDQDLALRHSAAGGTIVYLPEATAVHDDSATSLREYCRRAEWGAEHMAPFCHRYPAWPDNQRRRTVNGPISWSEDPPRLILRKAGKHLVGWPPLLGLLHALIERLEAHAPSSRLLASLYRLALGIHLQRGFRRGWEATEQGAPRVGEAP